MYLCDPFYEQCWYRLFVLPFPEDPQALHTNEWACACFIYACVCIYCSCEGVCSGVYTCFPPIQQRQKTAWGKILTFSKLLKRSTHNIQIHARNAPRPIWPPALFVFLEVQMRVCLCSSERVRRCGWALQYVFVNAHFYLRLDETVD